jgi:hypothetical protein
VSRDWSDYLGNECEKTGERTETWGISFGTGVKRRKITRIGDWEGTLWHRRENNVLDAK